MTNDLNLIVLLVLTFTSQDLKTYAIFSCKSQNLGVERAEWADMIKALFHFLITIVPIN